MSILNNKQITELSTPPTFKLTSRIQPIKPATSSRVQPDIFWYPEKETTSTHLSEEEIKKLRRSFDNSDTGYVSHRKLTEDEVIAFKPMISPFTEKQANTNLACLIVRQRTNSPNSVPISQDFDGDEDWNEKPIIPFGLANNKYGLRLDSKFLEPTPWYSGCRNVSPKNYEHGKDCGEHKTSGHFLIEPDNFIWGFSIETIQLPENILITNYNLVAEYLNAGLDLTAVFPKHGVKDYVKFKITNNTKRPVILYPNEGIAEIIFQSVS